MQFSIEIQVIGIIYTKGCYIAKGIKLVIYPYVNKCV